MRRGITYLLVFLILLALPFAVRWISYYRLGQEDRPLVPTFDPIEVVARVPTPSAGEFVDEPQKGQGLVLLDQAHDNQFFLEEIGSLDGRLAARGFEFISYENGSLASALRPVSAYVVIAPLDSFSAEEIQDVAAFVNRGGRVLLVGDPTRFNLELSESAFSFNYVVEDDKIPLNSLANQFDLAFNGDYLYNTLENEGNFRNIILKPDEDGAPDLLDGVGQLAFYGSHSIQTGTTSQPLLVGDDNTWSSATDRPGGLALAALSGDGVLAVGDVDFLSEPYASVYDNGRFIAQIADFLATPDRGFDLADFPYFYGEVVDLVFSDDPELGPDAFDEIIALQNAFRRVGKELMLADEPQDGHGVLYLGLYNQADDVTDLLDAAGVNLAIESTAPTDTNGDTAGDAGDNNQTGAGQIESPLGSIQMAGTSLIVLQEEQNRPTLVVLAASGEGLEGTIRRLIDLIPMNANDALTDCLLQDDLAFCPTGVADEPVEAELDTSGRPDLIEPVEEEETEEEEQVDLEAAAQGTIELGETVEGTMAENEAHSWTFSQGPALVDIILQSGEDMDGILELYDPEGFLLAAADSSFDGEEEQLAGIPIPDDGDYTIVVRDFYEDGGSYSLTVDAAEPQDIDAVDQGELVVGEPVDGLLEEGEAHSFTFQIEGPSAVTINLQSSPDIDGILALFDQENNLLAFVDDTLDGGEERLEDFSLADPGTYTVVVGDFFEDGGAYTLLLESVVPEPTSTRAATSLHISAGAMFLRLALEQAAER